MSPIWQEFEQAAQRYCALIEAPSTENHSGWLREVAVALGTLYCSGLLLPEVDAGDTDVEAVIVLPESLGLRLEGRDLYWMVFDAYDSEDREAIPHTLSDDLGDIYRDLKRGIQAKAQGVEETSVFWHWRFLFEIHWGQHAVSALCAIHSMLYGAKGLWSY